MSLLDKPWFGTLGRAVCGAAGLVCFGLGAAGAVLPVLPTTPFLLLAGICFTKSSPKVEEWFHGTRLYRSILHNYVSSKTMTARQKVGLLLPVTVLMGIGFALMGNAPAGRVVIAVVWAAHIIYFGFVVKSPGAIDG